MQSTVWLLLVVMVASATADDRITGNSRVRKVRRGDNLIPRVISELMSDLGNELRQINPSANAIFSPVSILSVLGMVTLGARGRTYKELANTLVGHVPGNLDKNVATMHRKLKYLLERLEQQPVDKPGVHTYIANAMFVQSDVGIQDVFTRSVQNIYNSSVQQLDFFGDGEGAKDVINNWVNKNTRGSIKELFSSAPDPGTKLVLANAIYFVGEWEEPFDPNETITKSFHTEAGDIDVPMMVNTGSNYYFESTELKCAILGKPYKGNHVTMYFVLPDANLTDFLKTAETDDILALKNKAAANQEQVSVFIPRMKLESTVNLAEPLANLGLKSLFGGAADLRGLAEGVFVNDALHKVSIEVSETGTIAAAATAIHMTRMWIPSFILDRPFLFFIYHEKAKIPLFWGTVLSPTV